MSSPYDKQSGDRNLWPLHGLGSVMIVNSCSLEKLVGIDDFIAETASSNYRPNVKSPPMLSTCIRSKPSCEAVLNIVLADCCYRPW